MICYSDAFRILKTLRKKTKDIVSPEDFPAFCSSAMDGFLLRAPSNRGKFYLNRQVAAGNDPLEPADDEAIEIMTGAPIYFTGHEAVIRLEDVERFDNYIDTKKAVVVAENIRMAGSDIEKGQIVLRAGTPIEARHIMMLEALGVSCKKTRVAIISTGNEIANGQIRNSTAPFLEASLAQLGVEILNLGVCPDDANFFDELLKRAKDWKADVIISTGAVSVGAYDFVKSALQKHDAVIHFHGVAIRPGKPILCASVDDTMFFGLPGNPMASVVGFEFFVKPYLGFESVTKKVKLRREFRKPKVLRLFCTSLLSGDEVDILDKQASYGVFSFAQSNAWVILPEGIELVKAGEWVDVL